MVPDKYLETSKLWNRSQNNSTKKKKTLLGAEQKKTLGEKSILVF
jgi:hypothetical protein